MTSRLKFSRYIWFAAGADVSGFNLEQLIKFTSGWTGAEIEQCVISALTNAHLEDREADAAGSHQRRRRSSCRFPAP